MANHPVVAALEQAVTGLLYISDSEAELEPFLWDAGKDLSQQRVLELAGAVKGTAIEESPLADFFRTVSAEDKPKFDKLAKVLKDQLSGVKVFKIGDESERQVYVVGKTSDGKWAGVKTTVVES